MLTKKADRIRKLKARAELREQQAIAEYNIFNGRGKKTRAEYAEFISGYNWEYFLTSTFRRPRRDPYPALKTVYNELVEGNVERAFLVAEPFQSGDLHIHGVVAGMGGSFKPEIELPWELWQRLYNKFGRAKVEACNSAGAVSMYCSKYLLKQQDRVCDYYHLFGIPASWALGKIN